MRRDCIVGMLGECDEVSDKETGNAMRRVAMGRAPIPKDSDDERERKKR